MIVQEVHEALACQVESGQIPGLVAALERRGELHVEALGTLAVGGSPIGRDAIFRIASMSKPVTAVATLILVEEGALQLDEPVDRLLPELAARRVLTRLDVELDETLPAERAITVRDLLTFTCGLGVVMAPPGTYPIQRALAELGQGPPAPLDQPGPDEWIARLGALPLVCQPGERWLYHTGADVLGVLVARASGRPFDAFLRERIFEPLGMVDTAFSVPVEKLGRFTASYRPRDDGGLELRDPPDGEWSRPPAFPAGGSGLVSTVDDFLAFGRMLLSGGRHDGGRILTAASVATMTRDQLTPAQKSRSTFVPGWFDTHGWGFGLSVTTRRDELGRSEGSFGWDGGLGTSWAADPAEGLNGVLLTQRMMTSPSPPSVFVDFWKAAYRAVGG